MGKCLDSCNKHRGIKSALSNTADSAGISAVSSDVHLFCTFKSLGSGLFLNTLCRDGRQNVYCNNGDKKGLSKNGEG